MPFDWGALADHLRGDEDEKWEAIQSIPHSRDGVGEGVLPSETVSALQAMVLEGPDADFRRETAQVLWQCPVPELLPALLRAMREDAAVEVRESAAMALQSYGKAKRKWEAVPVVCAVTENEREDERVRGQAHDAIFWLTGYDWDSISEAERDALRRGLDPHP